MFGGLSIKGQSKEETVSAPPAPAQSSSSGFSFLQSSIGIGASSGATTVDNHASVTGSAFGFLSSGAGTVPVTDADETSGAVNSTIATTHDVATAPAPPQSIFEGLNNPPALNKSPMTSSVTPSSGFSFLSAPMPPVAMASGALDADSSYDTIDVAKSTTSTAESSFNFMNSLMTKSTSSASSSHDNGEVDKVNGEGMLGAVGLATVKEEGTAPTEGATAGVQGMTSEFSFLSVTPEKVPPHINTMMGQQPSPLLTESSLPSDLLSLSNATLPVGSGVAWSSSTGGELGAAAAKKVVKKKRGKRVGIGSSGSMENPSTSYPKDGGIPEPTSQLQPNDGSFHSPVMNSMNSNNAPPPPPIWRNNSAVENPPSSSSSSSVVNPHDSPPMRIKAERAMDKAEEFIREKQKQRTAIALAAERAMQDRVADGGSNLMPRSQSTEASSAGSGWKLNNSITQISPSSSKDETYQAARAAAEEAKKLATDHASSHSKVKTSLFSSLFHRKSGAGGGSSNHDIASYSSHGGVISQATSGMAAFQRSGSGGIVSNGSASNSPLPPTVKMPDIDDDITSDNVARVEEVTRRWEIESALEQQRRDEFERQQMDNRRREEERLAAVELQRRREEEDRMEKQRIEAEKRRAPREKMQLMIDNLAVAARSATDDVARLRETLATLREQKLFAEKAERYAAQQIKFAETQQTSAVEEEDFEAADRLGTIIEQHTKEKEEQSRICQGINESIATVDEERKAASKAIASCFNQIEAKLDELQNEVDNRPKEEEIILQFAGTSKKLSSESERLATDLKHIERDEEVLAEEEKELDAQIEKETREYVTMVEDASKSLEEVNSTIEDLRKQLAEAEVKASDLEKVISSHNQSIQNVRKKFSRQLGRLEKKSRSVKESRADWTSEKESVDKAKVAHEAVLASHAEEMVAREKIIEDIKAERAIAKKFEEIASSAFEEIDAYEVNGEPGDDGSVDGEVLKYEAIMNEANQNALAAEANVAKLQEELSAIEVRIPILEAEKKAAAANRDFKSAGQASKEIKDAVARKEQCQMQLAGEAVERKKIAEHELQKITALLEEKKKMAAARNMKAGLNKMDCLKEKVEELKLIVKKFANTSNDAEDDTMSVSLVGAFVIESQICVLEAERRTLGEKYGVPVEPINNDSDAAGEESSLQSAPTFDSEDALSIDKITLEKYMSLRNEIQELESSIEDAVKSEDFDKAADLEERRRVARDMFESAGFSSEKFKQALEDFMEKPSDKDCDHRSSESVIDDRLLETYISLCGNIQDLEARVERAVADENFDDAANFEDRIKAARSDIEALGFSVQELENALANRGPYSTVSSSDAVGDGQHDVKIGEDNPKEDECIDDMDVVKAKLDDECVTEDEA